MFAESGTLVDADPGIHGMTHLSVNKPDFKVYRCAHDHHSDLMKVRVVLKTLKNDGWVIVRTRGSHRQLNHPTKPGTVTVSGKSGVEVPPGTLNSILKQAGLK